MQCIKCHSPRMIKFLDGFGHDRIFCKDCQESMLVKDAFLAAQQKHVWEFGQPNSEITNRWEYGGIRKIGSFFNTR